MSGHESAVNGSRISDVHSRCEEFRAHAAECRELAIRIRDLEHKRLCEQLERHWLELAERVEKQCRG
jgi:hypothetical protein